MRFIFCSVLIFVLFLRMGLASADFQNALKEKVVTFDREQEAPPTEKDTVVARVLLKEFYEAWDYRSAWIEDGKPVRPVNDLLNALRQADREGLRPDDYHLNFIKNTLNLIETSNHLDITDQIQLELMLTDAFLSYGSDLLSGRINPYSVDNDWFADRRTGNLPKVLEKALESGDIRRALKELLPTHPVYQRMRFALARYRQIERNGGWPVIPDGRAIKKGDFDDRVPSLRKRLYVEGDLNQKPNDKTFFDRSLERGLMRYQKRNGLDADGVLGTDTLKALNVPVAMRVRQLRINMERCRWLPNDLGRRYVFVNVPSFTLQIIEDNRQTLEMKVVVGRKMRQTPVFSSTMTHIVFNPAWSVPVMVARKDILDHIREEPGYLVRNNFEVYDGYDDGATLIDPATVDWSMVTPENLKYKFHQRPGPLNALGRIKFLLPNRFDVYLHDTPSRSLFSKTARDFSSGCIRVEKPVELACALLKDDARWSRATIEAAINKLGEQTIPLPEKVPVHLMYWTAWVDGRGTVQFREDIYGRDASLDEAINREPAL